MKERSLKISSMARGIIIAYGVAAFSWLFSRTLPSGEAGPEGILLALGMGLTIQVLAMLVRLSVKRYERLHRMEGVLYPQAMALFDLLADGVTVLLFATATFRAIASSYHAIL